MPVLEFFVGDAGRTWSVGPIGEDGETEELIAGRVAVRDTTIATVSDGLVHPVGPGKTTVVLQFGDCDIHIPVEVFTRASSPREVTTTSQFVEEFSLAGSDVRGWPLKPGQFTITLKTTANEQDVRLGVTDAQCYPIRREFRAITCTTSDSSVLVIAKSRAARVPLPLEVQISAADMSPRIARPSASEERRRRHQRALCPWTPPTSTR